MNKVDDSRNFRARGEFESGLIFRRTAAFLEQEGPVDLLYMDDAAVLHGLGCVGDLQELARGWFRIGEGGGW
jgi:hypothetical protein